MLGTDRSMWDEALRVLAPAEPGMEALRLELFTAALEGGVDDGLLEQAGDMLSRAQGFSVEVLRIPYCQSSEDALEILKLLHDQVRPGDHVIFDVTHGLRHLAMISLFSCLAVEALKDAVVREVYYAAFETPLPDGTTPVVRLDGLLDIMRWIRALAVYEARGDLSGMAPLLADEIGEKDGRRLADSAFYEQTLRLSDAREAARGVLAALGRTRSPVTRLFRPEIERQLAWARPGDVSESQLKLARKHLATNNYLLAALLGSEAALTWLMTDPASPLPMGDLEPTNERGRMAARERVRLGLSGTGSPLAQSYKGLADLRNALAHAGEPRQEETRAALKSAGALRSRLAKLLSGFFGE